MCSHPDPTKTYDDETIETPNDLKGEDKRQYTIQSTLVDLSTCLEVLEELGVDERVVSDVIINSTSPYRLSQRTGNFDSFIRSKSYK